MTLHPSHRHPAFAFGVISRGVTLFELLFVVMIIGLLLGVTVPRMVSTSNLGDLRGAMREMVALARYARQTAVMGDIEVEMVFSPEVGKYQLRYDPVVLEVIERLNGKRSRRGSGQRLRARDEERIIESHDRWLRVRSLPARRSGEPAVHFAALDTEVELESTQRRADPLPAIIFYPDGTASGGTVVLEGKDGRRMSLTIYTATALTVVEEGDAIEAREEKEQDA